MIVNENQVIGQLVAQDYRAASVFKKFGIDFCCQGNRTIAEACQKKVVKPDNLITELNATLQAVASSEIDFKSWPLDLLADYIEKKHHRFVEAKITEIKPFLEKICRVHGDHHPELFEIQEQFLTSAGELTAHMKKEELIVFPFVRKLTQAQMSRSTIEMPHFGTIENPIHRMMDEHSIEGERFMEISELTNNYTAPEDACTTYRVTFELLKEFEQDLHLHIHLENNILFPKAIALEKILN